jgi:hypothetical protein
MAALMIQINILRIYVYAWWLYNGEGHMSPIYVRTVAEQGTGATAPPMLSQVHSSFEFLLVVLIMLVSKLHNRFPAKTALHNRLKFKITNLKAF